MNWDNINEIRKTQEKRRNENIIASEQKIEEVIKSKGFEEITAPHLKDTEAMIFRVKTELTASGLDGIEHNLYVYKIASNFFNISDIDISTLSTGLNYCKFTFTALMTFTNGQQIQDSVNCLGLITKTADGFFGIVQDIEQNDNALNAASFKFSFKEDGTWQGSFLSGRKDLLYLNGFSFNLVNLGSITTI